ncbi:MAG: DUF2851 family protein [Ignavibacteriales bacterium]|nr:DUF2851 family protein [Ignavibacteriales bacterium]
MNLSGSIDRRGPAILRGTIKTPRSLSSAPGNNPHAHVPEAVLRHIWSRQFLRSESLATSEGRAVQVLRPGILNHDCGPDFRDAVIVIGGTRFRGDIEFHRTPEDWIAHGHSRDPHYNTIILHVVLESKKRCTPTRVETGRIVPLIALRPFLSAPLEKIIEHMEREENEIRRSPLACFSLNDCIPAAVLGRILVDCGMDRLSGKTNQMANRLAEIYRNGDRTTQEPAAPFDIPESRLSVPDACLQRGMLNNAEAWEQLLAEGIMDGLGYSRNRKPFRRLSQILSIAEIRRLQMTSVIEIESVLFHIAGLMPSAGALVHPTEKAYVHLLSGIWKDMAGEFSDRIHATEWILSPARSSNLPTLRIAAAARLLFAIVYDRLFERLVHVCSETGLADTDRVAAMESLLQVKDDTFWSRHFTFAEPTRALHSLLGLFRRRDIVMNTCIPLMLLYADIFQKDKSVVMAAALAAGAMEENSVTRRMGRQLIKERYRVSRGIEQQGLLHLYRTLCTNNGCGKCRIHQAIGNVHHKSETIGHEAKIVL